MLLSCNSVLLAYLVVTVSKPTFSRPHISTKAEYLGALLFLLYIEHQINKWICIVLVFFLFCPDFMQVKRPIWFKDQWGTPDPGIQKTNKKYPLHYFRFLPLMCSWLTFSLFSILIRHWIHNLQANTDTWKDKQLHAVVYFFFDHRDKYYSSKRSTYSTEHCWNQGDKPLPTFL